MLELEAAGAGCCNESKWMLLQDRVWVPASGTDLNAACCIVDRKYCDLQYMEQTWMLLGCCCKIRCGACIRNRLAASQRTKWSCCKPPWLQLKFAALRRHANPRVTQTKKASSDVDENDKSQPTEPGNTSAKCWSWKLQELDAAMNPNGCCCKIRFGCLHRKQTWTLHAAL